jgi:hypothetical protein
MKHGKKPVVDGAILVRTKCPEAYSMLKNGVDFMDSL